MRFGALDIEGCLATLFQGFPNGRTGLGLLLLRGALGAVALTQGAVDLKAQLDIPAATWIAGLLAVAVGISLMVGILTPFASAMVGILTIVIWNSPMPQPSLCTTKISLALVFVMAASVALLGPGAFSLDARIFGLRKIIIPRRRPPDSATQAPQ